MNKNAIQKFAVWARVQLIGAVKQRAFAYEITGGGDKPELDAAGGRLLTNAEKSQRRELIGEIRRKGFDQVMEEAAYTWFNRFIALRFMEVNNYLPSKVRLFTDENGAFKPQILKEAMTVELDGLDRRAVLELLDKQENEALYKYLLITQCNALNAALPGMFEKIANWTELLFPDNLLRADNVLGRMISDIPEEDWKDAVQIIGWLYQYYNTELKDDTFAQLKKNIKITKERIPAATQLFTPDWIVRYMVENSLGRLWLEGHPNAELRGCWKYYLDEAQQEPEVEAQLAKIREEYKTIRPEDIKVIDPCMGSGHILVYAFDVLMQIYTSAGWDQREAAQSILKNNLYGLDIDDRAAQLAYFAVMMKARQYDRRLFSRGIQPNVYAIRESGGIQAMTIEYFYKNDPKLKADIERIVTEMRDAKEYGSILNITPVDFAGLYAQFDEIREDINMMRQAALDELLPLVKCAELLAQKYDVVVTNPPYMGASGMGVKLSEFVKKNYPDGKSDLFSCFIEHGNQMTKRDGLNCMVTMQSWMFLSSFEKMREKVLQATTIKNLMHMGNMVMGIAFGTAVTIFQNSHISGYKGTYNQIKLHDVENGVPKEFPVVKNRFAQVSTDNFSRIPGSPVAYWKSPTFLSTFTGADLDEELTFRQGMTTTDNEKYLRFWHEVMINRIGFGVKSRNEAAATEYMWFPYQKGGEYRKWYGNNIYVVYYLNDGKELIDLVTKKYPKISDPEFIIKNRNWYFKEGLTWSTLSSGALGVRYCAGGSIFDAKGSMAFASSKTDILYYIALLNSCVAMDYLDVLAPTMDFNIVGLKAIPFQLRGYEYVYDISARCVDKCRVDWDSYETSWDFKRNPLV